MWFTKPQVTALAVSFLSMMLLVLITISTPTTLGDATPFYFTSSTRLDSLRDVTPGANSDRPVEALRLGTWGYCTARTGTGNFDCFKKSHGYSVEFDVNRLNNGNAAFSNTSIKSSWTRGLAVHVVAFAASALGFILTFIPQLMVQLAAAVVTGISALLALIAFAIDIALYVYTMRRMKNVAPNAHTIPGPAFYMALIAIPLSVGTTVLVFLSWRSHRVVSCQGDNYYNPEAAGSSIPLEPNSAQKVREAYESSKV